MEKALVMVVALAVSGCGGEAGSGGLSKPVVDRSVCQVLVDVSATLSGLIGGTETGEEVTASLDASQESLAQASDEYTRLGEPALASWTAEFSDGIGRMKVIADSGSFPDLAAEAENVTTTIKAQPGELECGGGPSPDQ